MRNKIAILIRIKLCVYGGKKREKRKDEEERER